MQSSLPADADGSHSVTWLGGKAYGSNPRFKCIATSGDGHVVVGSDDGRVRLYTNEKLTQAKTSIPGLGLPITSVDVTYDGEGAHGERLRGGAQWGP